MVVLRRELTSLLELASLSPLLTIPEVASILVLETPLAREMNL